MSDDEKCKNCKFFSIDDGGECHKKPPKLIKSGIYDSGTNHRYASYFPNVSPENFCGKFKQKMRGGVNG